MATSSSHLSVAKPSKPPAPRPRHHHGDQLWGHLTTATSSGDHLSTTATSSKDTPPPWAPPPGMCHPPGSWLQGHPTCPGCQHSGWLLPAPPSPALQVPTSPLQPPRSPRPRERRSRGGGGVGQDLTPQSWGTASGGVTLRWHLTPRRKEPGGGGLGEELCVCLVFLQCLLKTKKIQEKKGLGGSVSWFFFFLFFLIFSFLKKMRGGGGVGVLTCLGVSPPTLY